MEKRIRNHVENLFRSFKQDESTLDIQEELISNLIDKANDLIESGLNEKDAFKKAIGNLGTQSELRKIFNFKTLVEFDLYNKYSYLFALVAGLIYIALGLIFDYWHPGWVIFLIALSARNFKYKSPRSYIIPTITLTYILIGLILDLWHPGWLLFPVGFIIFSLIDRKFGALWLMTAAIYISLGIFFEAWGIGLIVFLLASALSAGRDEIVAGLWLCVIAGYLFIGFTFDLWHPGWLIFLLATGITTIITDKSIVAFSWLIALAVYLYLGFEYSLWHPAWVIFIVAAAISAYLEEETTENKKEDLISSNENQNKEE